jgi:hypothetical protein
VLTKTQLLNGDLTGLKGLIKKTTGDKVSDTKAREFFETLPESIRNIALQHGVNDTVFQNNAIEFLEEKKEG